MLNPLNLFQPKAAPVRRPNRASSVRSGALVTEADWAKTRGPQSEHDLVLADHVLTWLQQLPQPARPSELCTRYPRVANRIALCWADPVLTEHVFDALLLSRRGKRNGFPPAIAAELFRLRVLHSRRKGNSKEAPLWDPRLMAVSDR